MAVQENTHHLVLGKLKDYLTGEMIPDTYDERYRQKIAKLLIEKKGYEKSDLTANLDLQVTAGQGRGKMKVDFLIHLNGYTAMVIKYAPGSLVTRRLSALSLSRIVAPYQVPFAAITNGEDAEIIDGTSGKVLGQSLAGLPDKITVQKKIETYSFPMIKAKIFDQASRIVFACEINGACPCDTDTCVMETERK